MPPAEKRAKHAPDAKSKSLDAEAAEPGKSWLVDMPLDIFMEVTFALIRCAIDAPTKAFRAFLLNRNISLRSWKAALRSVGELPRVHSEVTNWDDKLAYKKLPLCPDFISEPAYANLATTSEPTSAKYCEASSHAKGIYRPLPRAKYFYEVSNDGLCFSQSQTYPVHSVSDLQTFEEGCRTLNSVLDGGFVWEQLDLVKRIHDHAKLCSDWEHDVRLQHQYQCHEVVAERLKEWEEDLTFLDSGYQNPLKCHHLVRKPKRLTPAEWKIIYPPLVQFMETIKVKHMQKKREESYIERFKILDTVIREVEKKLVNDPLVEARPHGASICMFPAVQEILGVDSRVKLTLEDVSDKLSSVLPDLMNERCADAAGKLEKMVNSQTMADVNREDSVSFQCLRCGKKYTIHGALHHKHYLPNAALTRPSDGRLLSVDQDTRNLDTLAYKRAALFHYRTTPWISTDFRILYIVSPRIGDRINNLNRALGYSVDEIWRETLEDSELKFGHCTTGHPEEDEVTFTAVYDDPPKLEDDG
ncbi:hypothetical protein HYDPIDRAFT_36075 [Hydnomerulius pinastri MD-312]|nr:hypothetical protein HYDPIDRAFT_36075 [Hydnomerulius pinastri MD-312]